MALSLSFPSSKTDSGQSIFESEDKAGNKGGEQFLDEENVEKDAGRDPKTQKPWKSTPSLHLLNKTTTGEDHLQHHTSQQQRSGGGGGGCGFKQVCGAASFIPVPVSRRVDKSSLALENLINSNSRSNSAKGLPDVTESPQTPFSSDKPCDLLAQLEIVKRQREMESSGRDSITGESDSVDDNGNPVDGGDLSDKEQSVNDSGNLDDCKERKHDSVDNKTVQENKPSNRHQKEEKQVEGGESKEKAPQEKSPDEPKYFINAAALSEDNFELPPSPAPSPCSSHFNSLSYVDPYPSLCPFVPERCSEKNIGGGTGVEKNVVKSNPDKKGVSPVPSTTEKCPRHDSPPRDAVTVRSRVPVSKSFPDIVQTTFSNEEKESRQLSEKTTKDNSDTESLVADSLEELRQVVTTTKVINPLESSGESVHVDKPLKAFEQPLSSYGFDPMMTESQMGGISAEKPPEAWVIDFNSLSLESELMEQSARERKSSMGSNPNSLAFFVNLDDKTEVATPKEASEASSTPDKKIFTMFVDIGAEKEGIPQNQTKSSDSESLMSASMTMGSKRGIINKPVVNVMETSGCGLKYPMNRRFPRKIFQHRAAAEASRKAARMEFHKERDKHPHHKEQFLDSLEPHSFLALGPRTEVDPMLKSQLVDSTSSNRSSLHVANVLDASFTSSLLSSMENSSPADLEVCQGGPCFKLGKDLLRMFQDGINTDVNIMVNGKCIKAHKCILASRSQYFAAILSGNWIENAGNTINLDGFSYTVVQFTMYHVYSGTNEIPDTIDLLELATLTDLLGLEGLRENISQTIRQKFCHNFHRPCTGCIAGVIECFPIALAYGMDELHRKMTKWICKHFVRIWPTKAFANLGDELIEKCLRYSVNHLSVDNILDHTLGCDQLLTTMPTVRWTEPIFSIVGQLSEACVQYIGEHFCEVLQSEKFLLFGKGQTWNISRIEGTFMESLNLLKPDEACVSHTALSRLIELGTETIDEVEWSTLFVDFLKMLRGEIERYLLANASKAVLSKCWEQLGQDVRKRICTSSFMGFDKYGNKIVKNHGAAGGMMSHGHTTTTVPVQNVKPTSKDRQSHYGRNTSSKASSKQMSVPVTTTVSKEPNKEPILSPMTANPAKVASVRPMQATKQANVPKPSSTVMSNVVAPPTTVKPRSSSTSSNGPHEARENKPLSRMTSQKSFTPPTTTSHRNATSVPRKFSSVEREKSFSNNPRAVSTVVTSSSASRTPMKPLTPSKTDSPIIQHGSSGSTGIYGRSSMSRRTSKPQTTQPPKPVAPPTKVFLTNSAKAAAVSKPNLRGSVTSVSKRTPSSSATSLLSQQSTASSSKTSTTSGHGPASSRYLSAKDNSKASAGVGGFSARSSFSNVEQPAPAKAKVISNPPRRNTYSNAAAAAAGNAAVAINKNTSGTPGTSGATKRPLSGGNITGISTITTAPNKNMTEMQNNYSKDNVMSRSTIETDSGETKMRTLAEIGRSSTFSKDEPTILGKMDSSTYSTLDMEISP